MLGDRSGHGHHESAHDRHYVNVRDLRCASGRGLRCVSDRGLRHASGHVRCSYESGRDDHHARARVRRHASALHGHGRAHHAR